MWYIGVHDVCVMINSILSKTIMANCPCCYYGFFLFFLVGCATIKISSLMTFEWIFISPIWLTRKSFSQIFIHSAKFIPVYYNICNIVSFVVRSWWNWITVLVEFGLEYLLKRIFWNVRLSLLFLIFYLIFRQYSASSAVFNVDDLEPLTQRLGDVLKCQISNQTISWNDCF